MDVNDDSRNPSQIMVPNRTIRHADSAEHTSAEYPSEKSPKITRILAGCEKNINAAGEFYGKSSTLIRRGFHQGYWTKQKLHPPRP